MSGNLNISLYNLNNAYDINHIYTNQYIESRRHYEIVKYHFMFLSLNRFLSRISLKKINRLEQYISKKS